MNTHRLPHRLGGLALSFCVLVALGLVAAAPVAASPAVTTILSPIATPAMASLVVLPAQLAQVTLLQPVEHEGVMPIYPPPLPPPVSRVSSWCASLRTQPGTPSRPKS